MEAMFLPKGVSVNQTTPMAHASPKSQLPMRCHVRFLFVKRKRVRVKRGFTEGGGVECCKIVKHALPP